MKNVSWPGRGAILAPLVAALAALAILMPTVSSSAAEEVKIEWLTWSFFRITSPGGKVILTNPWATNPDSQIKVEDITAADIILVPTGHGDEVGNTVEIANQTGAKVVTTWEMAGGAFKGKIPNEQLVRTQPGSDLTVEGIKIRVVQAVHGTGGKDALYGGPALGFFITFENDYTLYFSGSTDLTGDMRLWGALFQPDGAILYASRSMNPRDVAYLAHHLSAENTNLKIVIPHHHRLKPTPGRSPADLGKALAAMGLKAMLLDPKPGIVYTLSK